MLLRRPLVILRRRAPLLVVLVLAGSIGGYLGASRTVKYQAVSELYVGQPITSKTTAEDGVGQELLADTLAPLASQEAVAAAALKTVAVGRSPAAVSAEAQSVVLPGTSVIILAVKDTDPEVAESLANAMASAFAQQAASLPPVLAAAGVHQADPTTTPPTTTTTTTTKGGQHQSAGTGQGTTGTVPTSSTTSTTTPSSSGSGSDSGPAQPEVVSVLHRAVLPAAPLATSTHRDVAIGAVSALVVGLVLVGLLDLVGLSARSSRQIEAQLDLPVLGVVPVFSELRDAQDPTSGGLGQLVDRGRR